MSSPSSSVQQVSRIEKIETSNIQGPSNKQENADKTWRGRSVSFLTGAKAKICSIPRAIVKSLSYVAEDICQVASIGRKLNAHVLDLWEGAGKIPGYFSKFRPPLRTAVGALDAIQIAGDLDYFVNRHGREDPVSVRAGRAAILVADVGSMAMWFEQFGFYNLGKIASKVGEARIFSFVPKLTASIPVIKNYASIQRVAASIGQLRVFSLVAKLTLHVVAVSALMVGYAFLGAEAIYRLLVKAKDRCDKIVAGLDASHYVTELALGTMVLCGVTCVATLGATAIAAIVLGVSSYLYKRKIDDDKKEKERLEKEQANKVAEKLKTEQQSNDAQCLKEVQLVEEAQKLADQFKQEQQLMETQKLKEAV